MYYVGIDVSMTESALCILDGKGKIVRETKLRSDPEIIARFYRRHRPCYRAYWLGIGLYRRLAVCRAAAAWLAGNLH